MYLCFTAKKITFYDLSISTACVTRCLSRMPRCFLAAKLKYPYVQWKEEQGTDHHDRREDDISVDEDEEIDVENDDEDTPALKYLHDLRRQAEHRVNLHFYPQDENMNITNPMVKKEISNSENVSRVTEHQPSVADEESSVRERLSFQLKYENHAGNAKCDHSRLSPHQCMPEQCLPDETATEDGVDARGAGGDYDHVPTRAYPSSFREKGALRHV